MENLKRITPHLLVIAGFVIVSLAYFSPVLSGKVIQQSDIVQYTGMAKEQIDYRTNFDEEPYWTNSAFGGMPTYQLGAKYPHNYIKKLDSVLRFLPRPADYLFLYFIGFYILLVSFKIRPLLSFFGALTFGFSTYLIIILGVGHNAKAHAVAYMPMVLAGVSLVFRKKYMTGGLLTLIAAALEIQANHFQMTYYLLILLVVVAIGYGIEYIKNKDFKGLGVASGILLVAAVLSIGANATNLLATSEYTKFSTRSDSELTFEPNGEPKESSHAMSYEYITEYSYGIFESLNLFVPRLTGGANSENVGENSHLYQLAQNLNASPAEAAEFAKHAPTYWGDQPIVAAPAYIGAVVLFLFVLALFAEKRKLKYYLTAAAVLSLLLSWGKNFPLLTDIFIDYVPLYNKFRAVSSIQVILELCIPALAILGLHSFLTVETEKRMDHLKKAFYCTAGVLVVLFFVKGSLSFTGLNDAYYQNMYGEIGPKFIEALKKDRKAMYTKDVMRSFGMVSFAFGVLYLFLKQKINWIWSTVAMGIIMTADLVLLDTNYVNKDHFVSASVMKSPFSPTQADKQILNDPGHFRVFEVQGAFNSARASYFHNSIGGYHAAKPRRIQQLFDYQLSNNNMEVLNMFNVKYIIQKDEQNQDIPLVNENANGNAWFVHEVHEVETADEEMKALGGLNSRKTAILNVKDFVQTEVSSRYAVDSLATIQLTEYKPNYLKYETKNAEKGLAVFSENYYPFGWKAFIDGKEVSHFRVDYVLRAMLVPAGQHTIEFKFEPEVVQKGSKIAMMSSLLIGLLILTGIGLQWRKDKV